MAAYLSLCVPLLSLCCPAHSLRSTGYEPRALLFVATHSLWPVSSVTMGPTAAGLHICGPSSCAVQSAFGLQAQTLFWLHPFALRAIHSVPDAIHLSFFHRNTLLSSYSLSGTFWIIHIHPFLAFLRSLSGGSILAGQGPQTLRPGTLVFVAFASGLCQRTSPVLMTVWEVG